MHRLVYRGEMKDVFQGNILSLGAARTGNDGKAVRLDNVRKPASMNDPYGPKRKEQAEREAIVFSL